MCPKANQRHPRLTNQSHLALIRKELTWCAVVVQHRCNHRWSLICDAIRVDIHVYMCIYIVYMFICVYACHMPHIYTCMYVFICVNMKFNSCIYLLKQVNSCLTRNMNLIFMKNEFKIRGDTKHKFLNCFVSRFKLNYFVFSSGFDFVRL